ncbi:InlB B-repeat-containing protein, partial [Hutsoniella sourekii]|uniref:InlB B-repeat-containing protein n=1 Tax=Hutsoniella sourekii TaxID=87650 RepID=UPI002E1EDCB2
MEPVEELAPVESANEVADPQNGPSSSELALDTTEEKVSEAKLEVAPSTRASLNAQESPAPQVKPYAAPEESGAEQPVEDQTGQDKNVTTEAEIAANWKSQPKDTNQWALAEDQNIVRISGSDPIKMTDISYGGAFIDESGRTNLRLIYSEASTANSIWARALFNFGELSQYIDYEQSKIHGKSRGPYTLEKFNNTEIGQLNIQDPAMIRASNRSNLPINIVLKEGVDLTTLADKNYPIEMRVTDIDFKRVYAHAPGDSALDYTTYTKSTIIPIKDQISSHFLKGGFQPASKDIARQKSFMTEFIANPEQYNDLSNTGILRTQYYSNRMFAKQKPTMYGEEAAYTQIFDAKLLNYMKEDDKGNVAYVNVLTDAKKVSPYSQNVAITRDMINQTPDGKYAYLVIGPEGFNRDGVKVVNIPKHDQYTILEGFYFTAIDYVIDKEKISADPTMVNENKIDFAVASGFTNPNKAGWVHYENTVSQDTIISKGDAIFIDVGEKPAQDQIMVQIGDDKYNFVHTTHGYYNGSYDTDAANFAQITKSSKDGLYKLTFNEGRTLKAGQEIKVYLPYDSEGQPSIHLGQPIINNATEENEGAATLSIEPDGNIRLKMFSAGQGLGKKDGSFKLIYTPRGGNQQEAINFTKNGIKTFWQNDDKNDVLISSNTATTTSGGLYFIKTDKLELGEDVVVEAYSPEGNKIEEWTTILTDKAYSLVDRNENYKGLTWVDQTNTSSVGSIIKSLYVPYQEIFTNDYAKGTDDFYVNPNVAPAKASDFMKNTTNIIGYTKYDGGDVRLRYINPQQITYIGKTQAAANEYDSDGNISKDRTIEVTINGETFSAFAYDIDLSQLSELRAPGSGSAPKLYKDMKLLFNASDGSSLPSNTVEARVRTRVLFDATDGKLADGESAVRVVPDNVKYYGEEGYVANGFAGDNIQAGTGDSFVADPTAEGKTFLGWVTAEGKTALGDKTTVLSKDFNALDGAHKFTDKTPVGSHQVVYAIWSEEALVKFDANGGSFTDATSTKTDDINDGIQEPEAPSQEGKTFKGWATTADATTPDVDLANIDQPTTIYAVWEDVTPEETNLELVNPEPTPVQNPAQLSEAEKTAVDAAVRQANPDLPADAVITVGDTGEVTVTSGNKTGTIPSAQTVVEDTALDLTPPTAVEVQDPTQLTADEKTAVEEAVRQANPDLPTDATIEVADNGEVTVTSGNKTGSLSADKTV